MSAPTRPPLGSPQPSRVFGAQPSSLNLNTHKLPSSTASASSTTFTKPPLPPPPEHLYEDSPLPCPICGVSCPSLLALNMHLDDTHSFSPSMPSSTSSPDFEDDPAAAIMSWLRTAQKKVAPTLSRASAKFGSLPQLAAVARGDADLDDAAEETVTRAHWQKEQPVVGVNVMCSSKDCGKVLGVITGKVNCRKCGRLFCDAHLQMQMRLAHNASHDPINGIWCRVCKPCYMTRDYYIEEKRSLGASRDRTQMFIKLRRKNLEKSLLESNRLEKRLEKLAGLHTRTENTSSRPPLSATSSVMPFIDAPPGIPALSGGSILSRGSGRRASEQQVVKWEDDNSVTHCPFCRVAFGTLTNRKHHCRLCGRVVCGSSACSMHVPLFLNVDQDNDNDAVGHVRTCRTCKSHISKRREMVAHRTSPPEIIRLYDLLIKYRRMIEDELPRFNQFVFALSTETSSQQQQPPLKPSQLQTATRLQKELSDLFAQFDAVSNQIKRLPPKHPTETRLHTAIHLAAASYLQQSMLPVKLLPQLLKSKEPPPTSNSLPGPVIEAPRDSPLDALRGELAVLREQRDQVEKFVNDAQGRRKFDDVKALKLSLVELDHEIDRVRKQLNG